jgi:hypothetical protein
MKALEQTTAVREIPEDKLPRIKRRNRLGVWFILLSLPFFGLAGFVIVKTESISVGAIFFALIGVFMAITGGNLYSGQYTRGAVELALKVITSLGGLRR